MKGFGPLIIGLFVIGVVMVVEIAYLTSGIAISQPIIRAVRESEIIRGINNLEFAKQYLLQSALYSYYQASYDIANRGGYSDLTSNSYNCIPYWQVYSKNYAPDLQTNLKNSISTVFTKYISTENIQDVTIPTSFLVDISNHKILTISSADTLKVGTTDFYTAEELFSFSQNVDGRVFDLFNAAQSTGDAVSKLQVVSTSYSDLSNQPGSKLELLKDALNANYLSQNMQISFSSENLATDNTNYAARILVTVTDTSNQIPSYDFTSNNFDERNLNFKFYMLLGNSNMQPPVTNCESIHY